MNRRPSSSRLVALASLLGVAVAILTGCGAEDEQLEARYPQGGTEDTPRTSASLEAIPPRDPTSENGIAIGVDGEDDGYAESDPTALTAFKPTLDKYGTWEDDGTYGTVWYPSRTVVGNDFAPYVTAGHWVHEDEYVWVSDYDWGWAPFHYGRWVYIANHGWAWIPGRRYAGAWVTWRTGYDGYGYVGWAPLPPTWYWRGGYAYGLYAVPPAPYVFCPSRDVFAPAVAGRVVTGPQVPVVAANTRPYVPAAPSVGNSGRVPANPGVSGPPPGRLGFNAESVPRAPRGHVGLLRAQQESGRVGLGAPVGLGGPSRAPIVNGTRTVGGSSEAVYSSTPSRIDLAQRLPSHATGQGGGPQGGTPPTFSPSPGRSAPTYGGYAEGTSRGSSYSGGGATMSGGSYSGGSRSGGGSPSFSGGGASVGGGARSGGGSPSFGGGAPSGGGARSGGSTSGGSRGGSFSGGGGAPSGGGARGGGGSHVGGFSGGGSRR